MIGSSCTPSPVMKKARGCAIRVPGTVPLRCASRSGAGLKQLIGFLEVVVVDKGIPLVLQGQRFVPDLLRLGESRSCGERNQRRQQ